MIQPNKLGAWVVVIEDPMDGGSAEILCRTKNHAMRVAREERRGVRDLGVTPAPRIFVRRTAR